MMPLHVSSAKAKVRSDTCGLHGVIQVFSRLDSERRSCSGNVTDWSDAMCGSTARLRMTLTGRCPYSENATILALIHQGRLFPSPVSHTQANYSSSLIILFFL